VLLEIDKTRT